LDEPVGKRRFAVVNMGDDGKITDVLHHEKGCLRGTLRILTFGILTDFDQISTNFSGIQMITAQLGAGMHQQRHQGPETLLM
jgi:hypothetical protein